MLGADFPSYARAFAYGGLPVLPHSSYVHREGPEERSALAGRWRTDAEKNGVSFVAIENEMLDGFTSGTLQCSTRSLRDLDAFLRDLTGTVYLDVTGLDHSTWAPILKRLVDTGRDHRVVYTEPLDYRRRDNPSEGLVYDLSEKTRGIAPIPQFARLSPPGAGSFEFVALIGFEGARLSHISRELDVDSEFMHPVVGVPGFRWNHPFEALEGNMPAIRSEVLASRMRIARADSPFEAFSVIDEIDRLSSVSSIVVAPIGTKPHGIGAVLYAIARPVQTHLIYDHPVRSEKRSTGFGRTHEYLTGEFATTSAFLGVR